VSTGLRCVHIYVSKLERDVSLPCSPGMRSTRNCHRNIFSSFFDVVSLTSQRVRRSGLLKHLSPQRLT